MLGRRRFGQASRASRNLRLRRSLRLGSNPTLSAIIYATQLHYTHTRAEDPNQIGERINLAFRVKRQRVEDADSSGIYR
jgi:hypothetical protein